MSSQAAQQRGKVKMNGYMLSPVSHDLDGLTFPTNQQELPQVKREYGFNQDFGFDPSLTEQNMFDQFPDSANRLSNWDSFGNRKATFQTPQDVLARKYSSAHRHSLSLPQLQQQNRPLEPTQINSALGSLPLGSLYINTKNLPNTSATMSVYGQVTPPRSNSATSEPSKNGRDPPGAISGQSTTKRRRGKAQSKNPLTPPEDSNTSKRRKVGARKRTAAAQLQGGNPEDDRRKASLEKNRVAAAKCRVNKKEKTEQLQRDSHTKAQENSQLRGLVETMEAERNNLAAYLGAHASCIDCKNPTQLKEALQIFQEDQIRRRFPALAGDAVTANTSPVLSVSDQSMTSGLYDDACLTSNYSVINPPLPDFNLGGDYDMNSPLPS
jgi:hypothetical protein